ncbi:hypothetical protein CC1G_08429 [Coprinopsis cinerea okayama7|uniref:Uncharacterized protein n=1 Tax=Coprinopsis cinerea (strain Okayama-7 / 130 / ATCC MYA-4618 / FGSC 9003) TaxID=240176 RepID=A8NAR0_COPC7|nr:hypothetical protein CC1G_08429 [Coprinopsis cinerea okayama7\|eukprot:XP_001831912.2 hypothetical protein CC1G_08429 [Coprinopsis cinerea okayama7\
MAEELISSATVGYMSVMGTASLFQIMRRYYDAIEVHACKSFFYSCPFIRGPQTPGQRFDWHLVQHVNGAIKQYQASMVLVNGNSRSGWTGSRGVLSSGFRNEEWDCGVYRPELARLYSLQACFDSTLERDWEQERK